MADTVKHKFHTSKPVTADTLRIRSVNWNEEHVFGGGNSGDYLSRTAAATDGASWISPAALTTKLQATLLSLAYPIGAIYTSTAPTNPATLFGFGTWAVFGAGRAVVGVDTGQSEFDTVEKTGGEKTHVLTIAEMAPHSHTSVTYNTTGGSTAMRAGASVQDADLSTTWAGGSTGHNNLQPYIVVYRWKRTA